MQSPKKTEKEIDDLVEAWHTDAYTGHIPLHVFLDMTVEEFELYLTNPTEYFKQ